jgi:hypothetical protein
MRHRLITFALIFAAVAAPQAGAGGLLEELGRLGLNNDDFNIAAEVAERLYSAADARAGAHTTWANPETGAEGEIEILEFDGRCAMIKHVFRSEKSGPPHRVDVRRCRGDDGVWRISG